MSKITNDGSNRSGTGFFIAVVLYPYGNSGHQRAKYCVLSGFTHKKVTQGY